MYNQKKIQFVFIVFFTLLNVTNSKCQCIVVSPGISYQRQLMYEINFWYANIVEPDSEKGELLSGFYIGVEDNLKADNIIAPKIGIGLSGGKASIKLSSASYIQNNMFDLRLTPEIGYSYYGLVDFTYGYKIRLTEDKLTDLSNHKITFQVNINKWLWNDFLPLF